MFMVNTYGWDFATVAALAAPRPLLFSNSDKDTIFPLDGVYRVHQGTRSVYDFTKSATKNLGLIITEGPHKDTQELQVPAFHWFNQHFKNEEGPIELLATPLFSAEQLKVFKELPADQVNTTIQQTFVPQAVPPSVVARRSWLPPVRKTPVACSSRSSTLASSQSARESSSIATASATLRPRNTSS